jgi:hypothetical protein
MARGAAVSSAETGGGRRLVYPGKTVQVYFELDRPGIAAIAMGPQLAAAVIDLATTKALPYAIEASPRSAEHHRHYQDSFVVVPGTAWIAAMKRVAARLVNTSDHAAAVEWGSQRTGFEGHHVLGHTLDYLNSFGHRGN